MDKNLILQGTAKYFRKGSRQERHQLILDDIELSESINNQISQSLEKHKLDNRNKILRVQDIIRFKLIEIRLLDVKK